MGEGRPLDLSILLAGLPPGDLFLFSRIEVPWKPAEGNKAEAQEVATSAGGLAIAQAWPKDPRWWDALPQEALRDNLNRLWLRLGMVWAPCPLMLEGTLCPSIMSPVGAQKKGS
jgi:hypothetical protein